MLMAWLGEWWYGERNKYLVYCRYCDFNVRFKSKGKPSCSVRENPAASVRVGRQHKKSIKFVKDDKQTNQCPPHVLLPSVNYAWWQQSKPWITVMLFWRLKSYDLLVWQTRTKISSQSTTLEIRSKKMLLDSRIVTTFNFRRTDATVVTGDGWKSYLLNCKCFRWRYYLFKPTICSAARLS